MAITASLALYENNLISPPQNLPANEGTVAWQNSLSHTVGGFTVADNKVFVSNGNVSCFDAASGRLLWNATSGYGAISVSEGKVYVATYGSTIKRLDESTGKFEVQYYVPTSNDRLLPTFSVADGLVFAGSSAFNAATGEMIWSNSHYQSPKINHTSAHPSKSNYVLIQRTTDQLTERIDPDNGRDIWNFTGYASRSLLISDEQVILWNYATKPTFIPADEHSIVCLNKETGKAIWNYSTASQVFQPAVADGLVMFGSQDGYFYALSLVDGSLKWKTYVDLYGLIQGYGSHYLQNPTGLYIEAAQPLIDTPNHRIYWNVFTSDKDSKYSGVILSLNTQNGNRTWITPFSSSAVYIPEGFANMALQGNKLFVSANLDLYCVDAQLGNILWKSSFNQSLSRPLTMDNMVFIAADLNLIAYK